MMVIYIQLIGEEDMEESKKLIKLSDTHYVVVDDSEIKEGDWSYDVVDKEIFCVYSINKVSGIIRSKSHTTVLDSCKKITHSNIGHLYQDSIKPLSISEVEEAIYGYSVNKMAENSTLLIQDNREKHNCKEFYISGFKAHQELTKDKLFTIEDLELLISLNEDDFDRGKGKYILEEFIDDFKSEKTEWNIELVDGKIKLI